MTWRWVYNSKHVTASIINTKQRNCCVQMYKNNILDKQIYSCIVLYWHGRPKIKFLVIFMPHCNKLCFVANLLFLFPVSTSWFYFWFFLYGGPHPTTVSSLKAGTKRAVYFSHLVWIHQLSFRENVISHHPDCRKIFYSNYEINIQIRVTPLC